MGGRNSWLAAASGHGLNGAVGFYGFPTERNGAVGPAERANEIECPILALQAGADQNITKVENDAFEAALSAAGVDHEIVVYDGAPHSFFDRKQEEFAEASEDAWSRTLRFIEQFTVGRQERRTEVQDGEDQDIGNRRSGSRGGRVWGEALRRALRACGSRRWCDRSTASRSGRAAGQRWTT